MIKILRPDSLVKQVVAALRDEIDTGRFPCSSRLPAEHVLAEQFAVSRPVVREAISQLKADGILTTRKGSGAYVSENPSGNVFRLPLEEPALVDFNHLFELRFWNEIGAAEVAARRRNTKDLKLMKAAMESMHACAEDFKAASAADVAFHHSIAAATHNPYIGAFADFVGKQLLHTREIAWKNSAQIPGGATPAQQEHLAIYRAIEAGDAAAAGVAAKLHLLAAARRMQLDVGCLENEGQDSNSTRPA